MGLRYRRSINFGGFRINFSKSGIGYSFGRKGFRYTKTATGKDRMTFSIPGTGVSWVEESNGKKSEKIPAETPNEYKNKDFEPILTDFETVSADFEPILKKIKHFIFINKQLKWFAVIDLVIFIMGMSQVRENESPRAFLAALMLLFPVLVIWKIIYKRLCPVKLNYNITDWESKIREENIKNTVENIKNRFGIETELKIQKKKPYFIKTNADVYSFCVGKEYFYILPDMVIVKNKNEFGAMPTDKFN